MVFYLTLPRYALAIRPIGLIRPIRPIRSTYLHYPPAYLLAAYLAALPTSSARQLGLPALPPAYLLALSALLAPQM